jgi:lysophospholipase L1-like esterase
VKQVIVITILLIRMMHPASQVFGQPSPEDPTWVEYYPFIHYEANTIISPANGVAMSQFFQQMDTLIFRGAGKVNIVHIGGSHLQTDVYSHQVRTRLQNLQPGMNGGRGLVFPVSVAGSNNPRNFTANATGNWQSCRNTQRNATCNYGLTGIMIGTADTLASITIANRDLTTPHHTTSVRVYFFDPTLSYSFDVLTDDPWLVHSIEPLQPGVIEVKLNSPRDTITLVFSRPGNTNGYIEVYGIELTHDDPGLIYHSVGVNGASIPSFLRSNLLAEQLALMHPDLVILSLGTNDAFTKSFDPEVYRRNYIQLIGIIRSAAPQTSILITVPNDVYLNKKRINHNTSLQEEVIFKLAESHGCAVWNFFGVMGGTNSVPNWYNNGMMQKDRVHFTPKGYLLKGDLLFSALMKAYGDHLEAISSDQTTNHQ